MARTAAPAGYPLGPWPPGLLTHMEVKKHGAEAAPLSRQRWASERSLSPTDVFRTRALCREPPRDLHALLDRSVSLERAWAELNWLRRVDVPRATVEALVYELRTHGLAALSHPNCLRRLEDVSTAQLHEVLARLIKLRPKYLAITDDLLLKLGGLL